MHPSTRVARSPHAADPAFGGLVPPIYPATSYGRDAEGGYPGGHSYSRDQNPTGEVAEALITELEGGAETLLFASGMAAATALLDALEPGTHVVAGAQMYWTIRGWLRREADAGRLTVDLVDATDLDAWRAALAGARGPQLVWLESPSNPMGVVTDLTAVAALAHEVGAAVAVDNTTATPVHTRPIEHGADVVFHSATKQLNGHGDVLAGALVTAARDERWDRVRLQRAYRGAVLGPFEAWLLARGLRTLYARVPRSSASALAIAHALEGHPAVAEVRYAGLPSHPGHDVAARQMGDGFSLLLSIRVAGGEDAARRVLRRLRLFVDATSLGGTESLVEHRARIEGEGSPVPTDLLRLAIGLEHPDDLITDLREALDAELTGRT